VQINKQHIDEQGKSHHYDMCKGKYEPIVTLGRAYGSKRQDSFATFQQLLQTSPNLLPMVGDIVFKSSDLAGADQLAERFHKMLPPNLQDDAQNPLPPQAQAAMAQAQQQTQAMQGELAKLNMERQAKVLEHQGKMQQIDLQHKADMEQSSVDHAYSMQMEDKKLETQLAVAEINTKAQSQSERQGFLEDLVKLFHSQAHELGLQAHQQAHQQDMAQQQQEAQAQQSAQDAAQSQQVQAQTAPNGAAQPSQ
jgi:HSP90 family molecular chaperone